MKNFFAKIALLLVAVMLVFSFAACGGDAEETKRVVVPGGDDYVHNFMLKVVFKDGSVKSCPVATNEETVGAALLEAGLINGEEGPYGLYIKTVCGETADYETDGTYWALYVGGEYSDKGADSLKCADVTEVEFRVEK